MEAIYSDNGRRVRTAGDNRFMMMCGKIATEQRKTLLVTTGGYIGICAVLGLWSGFFGGAPAAGNFVFYLVLAWIACSLVASRMFSEITRKEGRTALLMTPARAADKFLPRLIIVLPGMLLLCTLGYLVYGYTDVLMMGMKFDIWPDVYNPFANWTESDTCTFCSMLAFFLLNESFFIFGAVNWPKKSFLKTFCLIAALQIALSFLAWGMFKVGLELEVYDPKAFLWSVVTIMTLIATGITLWAFIRFKRLTLV